MFAAVYLGPERTLIVRVVNHRIHTSARPGLADLEESAREPATVSSPYRDLVGKLVAELRDVGEVLVMGPRSEALEGLCSQLAFGRAPSRRVARLVTLPGLSTAEILRRVRRFYLRRGRETKTATAWSRNPGGQPRRREGVPQNGDDMRARSFGARLANRVAKIGRSRGRD